MTNSKRLYYEQQIKQLSGKNFNLNKFPDNQIYAMYIKYKNNPIQQKQSIQKQNRFTYQQYNTKPNRCTFCNSQLTDADVCPICDLGEEHYNENIKEGNIMNKEWKLVKVKQVYDVDGFLTDYAWYTDGNKHIFMFGDIDFIEPDEMYADYDTDTYESAEEWFENYNGFEDTDEFEYLDEFDDELLEDFNQVYEIEYTDRESGEEALKDTIKGRNQADAIDKYFKKPRNASNEITKITAKKDKKLNEVAPIVAAAAGAAVASFADRLGTNLADKITESADEEYMYQVGDIVILNGKDREKARVTDILDNNYYEVETLDSKEVYNVGNDEILYSIDENLTEEIEDYQVNGKKIDKDKQSLCTADEKDVIIEDVEDTPPAPALPGKDSGIANILIALIQSEWTAIDDYNNAIASLAAYNEDEMINVLEDIIAEENVHVGQLQKVLDTIAPNTKNIDEGTKEAEQQLNEPSEIIQQIQDGN